MKIPSVLVPVKPLVLLDKSSRTAAKFLLLAWNAFFFVSLATSFLSDGILASLFLFTLAADLVVPIVLWFLGWSFNRYALLLAERNRQRNLIENYKEWYEITEREGLHHITRPPFRLENGEFAYFVSENVELHVFGTAGSDSILIGGAARLNKTFSLGIGHSSSREVRAFRHLDDGTLCITNSRIFFVGSHENISVPLSSIIKNYNNFDDIEVASSAISGNALFCGLQNALIATDVLESLMSFNRS